MTDSEQPSQVPADGENRLRPRSLREYIGQRKIREQFTVFIQAAQARGEALDHVLLHGPPGLGKTTLAHIIAAEMNAQIVATSGPALERAGDIAAVLTGLAGGDILFIDEIHRLHPAVEETMYSALEDFRLDIVIGEGPAARSVKLDLEPFTLVGATTRAGMLTTPLRERFGIVAQLEFYNAPEIGEIVMRSAKILGVQTDAAGAAEIARRARRTPRVANRLLRRARDYAEVHGQGAINKTIARAALDLLEVDEAGLDGADLRYLRALASNFNGGPVGLDNLAIAVGEIADTVETVIEPYLIKEGLVIRTPRGRIASTRAFAHLGLEPPAGELWKE